MHRLREGWVFTLFKAPLNQFFGLFKPKRHHCLIKPKGAKNVLRSVYTKSTFRTRAFVWSRASNLIKLCLTMCVVFFLPQSSLLWLDKRMMKEQRAKPKTVRTQPLNQNNELKKMLKLWKKIIKLNKIKEMQHFCGYFLFAIIRNTSYVHMPFEALIEGSFHLQVVDSSAGVPNPCATSCHPNFNALAHNSRSWVHASW